jgi:hypothetical protein
LERFAEYPDENCSCRDDSRNGADGCSVRHPGQLVAGAYYRHAAALQPDVLPVHQMLTAGSTGSLTATTAYLTLNPTTFAPRPDPDAAMKRAMYYDSLQAQSSGDV